MAQLLCASGCPPAPGVGAVEGRGMMQLTPNRAHCRPNSAATKRGVAAHLVQDQLARPRDAQGVGLVVQYKEAPCPPRPSAAARQRPRQAVVRGRRAAPGRGCRSVPIESSMSPCLPMMMILSALCLTNPDRKTRIRQSRVF